MTTHAIPQRNTAAYRAALHLFKVGPLSRVDLFNQVHFGEKLSARTSRLDRAIEQGWLIETTEVSCCRDLARHFADLEPETPKAITGQVAGPRDIVGAYDRPALSKRFIPNSKGTRADVPTFSVRATPSFRNVGDAS